MYLCSLAVGLGGGPMARCFALGQRLPPLVHLQSIGLELLPQIVLGRLLLLRQARSHYHVRNAQEVKLMHSGKRREDHWDSPNWAVSKKARARHLQLEAKGGRGLLALAHLGRGIGEFGLEAPRLGRRPLQGFPALCGRGLTGLDRALPGFQRSFEGGDGVASLPGFVCESSRLLFEATSRSCGLGGGSFAFVQVSGPLCKVLLSGCEVVPLSIQPSLQFGSMKETNVGQVKLVWRSF